MKLSPFTGRIPVYIGDDVTDIDGIAAAKALGGRAFSVGQPLEGADGVFASPAAVRAWLASLAKKPQEARSA